MAFAKYLKKKRIEKTTWGSWQLLKSGVLTMLKFDNVDNVNNDDIVFDV